MKIKTILLITAFLVLITACANQSKPLNTPSQKSISSTGSVKEFTINAFRFGFEPKTIRVNLGDTVRIKATSVDVPHGLAIPEFGVNMYLTKGKQETVEFVANKKGTFQLYCSVPCGSGHGSMQGILIVE